MLLRDLLTKVRITNVDIDYIDGIPAHLSVICWLYSKASYFEVSSIALEQEDVDGVIIESLDSDNLEEYSVNRVIMSASFKRLPIKSVMPDDIIDLILAIDYPVKVNPDANPSNA